MPGTRPSGLRYLGELLLAVVLVALALGLAGALMSGSTAWGWWIAGAVYTMFVMPWWAIWLGFYAPGYFILVVLAILVTIFIVAGYLVTAFLARLGYLVVLLLVYAGLVYFVMSFLPPAVT